MENLSRFRWHTGAEPRRLRPGERTGVLFRDIGLAGMELLLTNGLQRLAGPMTPITYLRTWEYQEPYVDYGKIGRLVLLAPLEIAPWHSGIDHIYIASSKNMPGSNTLGFVPGTVALRDASDALFEASTLDELREVFGGNDYDQLKNEALENIRNLNKEHSLSERSAQPLRIVFQTGTQKKKEWVQKHLSEAGLSENDLCAAWHHLPLERRLLILDVLPDIAKSIL